MGAMEMPVFALHTVLFPGAAMGLRVFEPRYLALMDDVLPAGTFAVVAIRHGQEVGGPTSPTVSVSRSRSRSTIATRTVRTACASSAGTASR